MFAKKRLVQLEENLEIDYEKLDEFQKELTLSASATQKFELKQRIKRDVLPSIHRNETEYLNLLNQEAGAFDIPEQQASQAIAEITSHIAEITTDENKNYPPEVLGILREILTILNTSGQSPGAKLKATLPILPPIISYEVEIDTQSSLRKIRQILARPFKNQKKT
ncbi:MAG: hypothetical protein MGF17_14095 [Trichodesmium sp. MAG_R04]|nr:hypothetical protein [Trichodesmium sp. MAG_R04]